MPGTDLYMRILISANATNTGAVIAGIARSLGSGGLLSALGNLKFGFANLGTAGTIGMDAIKQGAVGLGTALLKIALVTGVIGGIIAIAIGVLAVRAAANFQQGLNRLVTGAGDVTDNMKQMGQAILGVSVATGVLTGPLLQAMYQIISAGQRGAQAQNTLAVAAKGAVVEQANVVDVAKALTTAMTDYGTHTYNATQFMNGYTRATQLGKITLEELSQTMGPILPLAQNIGIKFADVAGAMSTMTNAGIPAARAATSLRFLFQSLENPTLKASTAMKHFGLDSIKLANELKVSLPGALQMVYDAAKKAGPEGSVPFNRAVSDMIGGQRSLQAYLALTGTHLATFKSNTAAITSAMDASKTSVLGWATAQGNANLQLSRVKAAGQALLITLGQGLLPAFTALLAALVPIITGFTQWVISSGALHTTVTVLGTAFMVLGTIVGSIVHFFQQNEVAMDALKATMILLAIVVGVALAMAFYSAAVAVGVFTIALLTNPITWIIIAIIAVITGIILVITHWGQIMTWLGGIFSWLGSLAHTVFSAMGSFIGGVFSAIGTFIHDKLVWIQQTVGGIFSAIGTKIHDALLSAANFVYQKVQDIENFFKALPGKILSALATLGGILLAPFKWFYDHNYYVKAAVDSAINIFNQLKAQVGQIFSAIGTTIQNFLTWLKNAVGTAFDWVGTHVRDALTATKNTVGSIFSAIGTTIQNALTAVKNFVGTIFSTIGSLIHDRLTTAKNDVGTIFSVMGSLVSQKLNDLKNAVGTAFSNLGSLMHQKLTDAWNGLVNLASGWPSAAFNWGVNLVMGLVNGMGSLLGRVRDMAGQIAGAIGNFLGFHSPTKEGPGKELDEWPKNLVAGYTKGLVAALPTMQAALNTLMVPVARTLSGATPGVAALPQRATGSTGAGGHGPVSIHQELHIHTQQLSPSEMDHAVTYMGDRLREQMGNI